MLFICVRLVHRGILLRWIPHPLPQRKAAGVSSAWDGSGVATERGFGPTPHSLHGVHDEDPGQQTPLARWANITDSVCILDYGLI